MKKKKYINVCDHQNGAIDIVTDTVSPVINDIRIFSIGSKNLFFWDNREKKISPVTANFPSQLILVFLSYLEVSGNQQKPKRNYMTADGHTIIFRVWWASWMFDFF